MKIIEAHGRRFALGRRLPAKPHVAPRLEHFLDDTKLPTPPASVRWDRRNRPGEADPLGNTSYGDCCFAGILHLWDVWEGTPAKATTEQALALYKAVVPTFNPSDPSTDVGSDLPAVLEYVKANGMFPAAEGAKSGAGKIVGWVAVDSANLLHVKLAIWLFGGLYGGLCFPDSVVQHLPSHNWFYWDWSGAPDPNNGHCVPVIAYDALPQSTELFVDTWGLLGAFSQRCFMESFAEMNQGELYAPLSPDWADRVRGKTGAESPSGFDIAALETYLTDLG
jgi:hypothetical protein